MYAAEQVTATAVALATDADDYGVNPNSEHAAEAAAFVAVASSTLAMLAPALLILPFQKFLCRRHFGQPAQGRVALDTCR